MKWIRRKPSLKTRWWVSFFSVIFLSTVHHWVGGLSPGFGETQRYWTRVFYFQVNGPRSHGAGQGRWAIAEMYYIVERDGELLITKEGDDGYDAIAQDPASIRCLYLSGFYQSGLLAPTRWHDAKRLEVPHMRYPDEGGRRSLLTRVNRLTMRTLLVSERRLDPRLISQTEIEDGHIIWTGYLANALSLLALLLLAWAFLWSLAGVPAAIRGRTQRGRLAMGLCPKCAYNLEGTPDRCPECGWMPGDATAD